MNRHSNYQEKYLKYKSKYLELSPRFGSQAMWAKYWISRIKG